MERLGSAKRLYIIEWFRDLKKVDKHCSTSRILNLFYSVDPYKSKNISTDRQSVNWHYVLVYPWNTVKEVYMDTILYFCDLRGHPINNLCSTLNTDMIKNLGNFYGKIIFSSIFTRNIYNIIYFWNFYWAE